MNELYLTIGISVAITALTILMDFVASKMVTLSKLGGRVLEIDQQNYNETQFDELEERIKSAASYYKLSKLERNIWGNELAVVALSLDFTAVALWLKNPELFKFFSHFNIPEMDRSVLLCFLIILIHLVIFLTSLIFKNVHLEKVRDLDQDLTTMNYLTKLQLNQFRLYNNIIGFVALATSISLYTSII